MGDGKAYQTVVKHDDEGRQYVSLEPITCDDHGHMYSPLLTRGDRQGLPKINQRCICGDVRWTQAEEDVFQEAKRAGRVRYR